MSCQDVPLPIVWDVRPVVAVPVAMFQGPLEFTVTPMLCECAPAATVDTVCEWSPAEPVVPATLEIQASCEPGLSLFRPDADRSACVLP